ncbi:MAG: acyl-CoA dehydrogenase family protein [Chloroflexi bacterium]|nr:acyl-CoA dehydrogenase family protein [Chloroflexota bacterium]
MKFELPGQLREWRERTESIDAILRAEADHNEQLRHLSPAAMQALRGIEAFGICTPVELGGSDLHPAAQLDVVAAVSTADPSTGWNLMNGCQESAWLATRLPHETARRIFAPEVTARHFPVAAGGLAPEGEARQVDGGWIVNARSAWASGIHTADYVLAQSFLAGVEPESGRPRPTVTVAARRDEVVIEDTWHTLGMRGTGSAHYRFDNLFVPDGMKLENLELPPLRGEGFVTRPNPIFLVPAMYATSVGIARRSLEEFATHAPTGYRRAYRAPIAERERVQHDIGEAQAMLDAIEGYGYRLCELLHDTPIESTEEAVKLGDQARAAYRWCNQTTERIVQIVHAHMGGADVFESSMIQRLLRDIQTSSQHVMPGDSAFVRLGRHRLGIDVRPGI